MTNWPRVVDAEMLDRRIAKIESRQRQLRQGFVLLTVCLALFGVFLALGFREIANQRNAEFCALAKQTEQNAVASGAEVSPLVPAAAKALGCPAPPKEPDEGSSAVAS